MIKVFNFNNFLKNLKLFLLIVFLLLIIICIKKSSSTLQSSSLINTPYISCIDEVLPTVSINNESNNAKSSLCELILYSEIPFLNPMLLETSNNKEIQDNNLLNVDIQNDPETKIEFVSGAINTEEVDTGVTNTYTNNYNGVQIKNSSSYELTEDMLNPSNLSINCKDVIIFHTHTCESYTQSDTFQYEESGTYRTLDLERSVVKVGSVLTDYLNHYSFNVIHNTSYHDYPSYTGSYERSMETVQSILSSSTNTDIIIDIHRDAIADGSYAPSVKIGDETVAQLMFVLGTDGGGLEHPNWVNNLKFAVKIQEKANELYPGLFKPIILRNSRYNQNLGNAACIIEVGATGNTLDQSIASMKYLSYVLDQVLNK